MWPQPFGDVSNHGWINVLRRVAFRRRGRTCARKKEMVVSVVDMDGDIKPVTESVLPP